MSFIPGWLIGLVTFPGIIVHEIGHLLLCRIAGVKVVGWCLFRLKQPMGFVIHEQTESVWKNFMVTFGPFFLNSILTVLIAAIYFFIPHIAILWLAFSVGAHSFPSTADGKNLWNATIESFGRKKFWNALFLPFVAVIYLGALLSFFWIDFIYAGALIFGTSGIIGGELIILPGLNFSGHFENQYLSFNYPLELKTYKSGSKTYDELKKEMGESELYFVGSTASKAVVLYGDERRPDEDLNTFGEAIALIDTLDDTIVIQKKGLESFNSQVWYRLNLKISDGGEIIYKIGAMTHCKNKRINLTVIGDEYETGLFKSIVNEFKCK